MGYPVVDLEALGIKVRDYVWMLEESVIRTLHHYSISYITNPVTDLAEVGRDITVRLKGATSGAIIDNVQVTKEVA